MRVDIWDGTAPHAFGEDDADTPFLDIYLPRPEQATGAAMLVLPGGAYTFLSEKSGVQYGQWLASEGIVGIVVNFRLGSAGYHHEALLADAWKSLALVHSRADEWGIDRDRIGVIGSSAGGHLASMMLTGTSNDVRQQIRPALGVLCYPVISLRDPLAHDETRGNFLGDQANDEERQLIFSGDYQVDERVPPCFIWHTLEDKEVNALNAVQFAEALHRSGISYELHIYETGPHALGLARNTGLHWTSDCARWLRGHGF
ncbi:alpha/beta hydrolase [Micromonospora sp. NPDC000089]|uniref:alpha/beta hydrolase n=1 Tax=unclassified Micromonospora TaxID=2617518 RepID=UPI003690A781